MKKKRTTGIAFGILLGAVGLSTLFSSCHKERACDCTISTEFYNNGSMNSYSADVVINTEQKCWELNEESESGNNQWTIKEKTECEK